MILTFTEPYDDHALFVQEGLRAKGGDTLLWYTADLAQRLRASLEMAPESGASWRISGPELSFGSIPPQVIWHRRPAWPVISDAIHPADRAWARVENEEFHTWLLAALPASAFWVNSLGGSRAARSKIYQQDVARRAGLSIPRTLYSNDPHEIRAFIHAQGGRVAYKAFTQKGFWKIKNDGRAVLFTALLTADQLPDDEVLRATPGMYQPYLDKVYELRVTVMGEHIFAAKVDSQSTDVGKLDWRRGHSGTMQLGGFEPIELSAELNRAILHLMRTMGLIFGCLDFIVTPSGDHVFLEVNEMGQFLFVEELTGMPLLDAFCELLLQGRPDFSWDPARVTVRMGDFTGQVEKRKLEAGKTHVMPPDRVIGVEPDA